METLEKQPAPVQRPGWRTTEFWLTIVAWIAAALVVSEVDDRVAKIAALVGAGLKSLGYTASRTLVKRAAPVLLLALLFLPGCWTIRAYDAYTVGQVERTIDEQAKDHEWRMRRLDEIEAPPMLKNSEEALHKSRMARLEEWLRAERAKEAAE